MNRQQAIEILAKLKPKLVKRFGVTRLALFGSTVRDEAGSDSDIDVLLLLTARRHLKNTLACNFIWEMNWGIRSIW